MKAVLTGIGFLLGGSAAMGLVAFSARELWDALRHALARALPGEAGRRARVVWRSAARNLIVLGALLSPFGFLAVLSHGEDFPPMFQLMGERVFGPFVAALGLSVLAALAASRVAAPREGEAGMALPDSAARPRRWLTLESGLGYVGLASLLAGELLQSGARRGFGAAEWLLHAPAWLAVAAAAVAIALYRGDLRQPASGTIALGAAGALGAALGLLGALHGFAESRIEAVAGGLVFAFSASVASLVGVAVLGLPREDRAAVGPSGGTPARLVWYGLPIVTAVVVTIAWLVVSTPMKMR